MAFILCFFLAAGGQWHSTCHKRKRTRAEAADIMSTKELLNQSKGGIKRATSIWLQQFWLFFSHVKIKKNKQEKCEGEGLQRQF